jgi:hypothetical protein
MLIARAMCELRYVTVAALCSSCSLQKYLERWPAALNEAGLLVSVNEDPENWTQYTSFVSALFTVHTQ